MCVSQCRARTLLSRRGTFDQCMGTSPTPRGSVPRQPKLGFDEQLERVAALIRLAGGEALSVRAFNRRRGARAAALSR